MKWFQPRARRWALPALGLVLLGGFAWVVLRAGPMAPTKITVIEAQQGRLQAALFGIGTVEARRAYLIGPTSSARVNRVHVDVGDRVQAGQVLADMDPVDLDDKLKALDASIARAQSVILAALAQRQDGLAKQALADINARRYTELRDREFVSPSALEAKLQEHTSASAAAQAAEANWTAAQQDLQRLQAERAAMQRQRTALRLVAPASGVVTSREAEAGSTVVAGQPVLRLIEPESLWLRVRFDQGRSGGLETGLAARIVLRSDAAQALDGTLDRVEAVSDSVTEERVAMVAFRSPPAGLTVGELAEVTLRLPEVPPSVLVPNSSLQRQGQQTGVWVVKQGQLQFAPVRTGHSGLDGWVQVLEGLSAGERVVQHSEKALQPDTRIKVVDQLAGARP
jgi:HlyD family secretion protein